MSNNEIIQLCKEKEKQQQQQQMEEDNEMPQSFSNLESLTNIIRKLHQTLNKQEKFQLFLSESTFDTLPTLKLITQPFKIKFQRGLLLPSIQYHITQQQKKKNFEFTFFISKSVEKSNQLISFNKKKKNKNRKRLF